MRKLRPLRLSELLCVLFSEPQSQDLDPAGRAHHLMPYECVCEHREGAEEQPSRGLLAAPPWPC